MSRLLLPFVLLSFIALGACSQNGATPQDVAVPERGDSDFLKARYRDSGNELYINPEASKGGELFRRVYIARTDTANMQIIQPEGVDPHDEWSVRDLEADQFQKIIQREYTRALSFESAYQVVDSPENAEMILKTRIVAVHPNASLAEYQAGSSAGGSITISTSLRNAQTNQVMIRAVDSKSTDNIWAFHDVGNEEDAVDLLFRAWGNQIRRGLLQLQGRVNNAFFEPLELKAQ